MGLVTVTPRGDSDGSIVRQFGDSIDSAVRTYTYDTAQESLTIRNKGYVPIVLNVGSYVDITIAPLTTWGNDVDFSFFTIKTLSGMSEIQVTAREYDNKPVYKKDFDSQMADIATQLNYTNGSVSDYIQSIIDNAGVHTVVKFEKGKTYVLDKDLILKSNILLDGNGCTMKGKTLILTGCTNVTIKMFTFDGDSTTATWYTAIKSNGNANDIYIYDNTIIASQIQFTSDVYINPNTNVNIYKNRFRGDTSLKVWGYDILALSNTKNSLIIENDFNMTGVYRFIKMTTSELLLANHAGYTYSVCENGYCDGITISNNKFIGEFIEYQSAGLTKQAIDMFNGATNIIIDSNVFKVNMISSVPLGNVIEGKSYGSDSVPTYTRFIKNIVISNNHIEGNFLKAIALGNLYGQNVIKDSIGNIYADTDSFIRIESNNIICKSADISVLNVIYIWGQFQIDVLNNAIAMNKTKTLNSVSINILSCGYINIFNNKLLNQSKIFINDMFSLDGAIAIGGLKRFNCILNINITKNIIEFNAYKAIQFYNINNNTVDASIRTMLQVSDNLFYNNDIGQLNSIFNTDCRFNSINVRNNNFRTDGTGVLYYPNYSNMCVNPVIDENNTWTNMFAAPTTNTWNKGQKVYTWNLIPNGYLGWICTTAGTMGTLNANATTGSITTGINTLTVNSVTGLSMGCKLAISGIVGQKTVTAVNGLVVTLDSNADATVTNASVTFSPAVWKGFGLIQA